MISGLEKTAAGQGTHRERRPARRERAALPAGEARGTNASQFEKTVSSGVRGQRWREGGTMSRTTEPSAGVSARCTVPVSSPCEASGQRARSRRRRGTWRR